MCKMIFTLPKISFSKRYIKALFSRTNLIFLCYVAVINSFIALNKETGFWTFIFINSIPFIGTLILPIVFLRKYVYELKIENDVLYIEYMIYNRKYILKKELDGLRIYYDNPSRTRWIIITFGQKVHGYNNKVFLTQYLFADWNNKEKLKEFVKFVEDNNITNNFKQIDWKNV